MTERAGERTEGPLEELRRRIEDAQTPRPLPVDAHSDSHDPLEALRARVESAADLAALSELARAGNDPLGALIAKVDRAVRRTANGTVEPTAPDRPPSSAAGDPVQRLRRMLAAEMGEIGERRTVDLSPRSRASPEHRTEESSIEQQIGREVLALLEANDLPGRARAEAVRRLAGTLDDPDAETVREVLRLLVAPSSVDSD